MTKESLIKTAIIGSAATIICALALLYACRNIILHNIVQHRVDGIEKRYDLRIAYSELRLKGCRTLRLREFTVTPNHSDTLCTLNAADIKLGLWSLMIGNINIRQLDIEGLTLNLVKRDSVANYDALFRHSSDTPKVRTEGSYSRSGNAMLRVLFDLIPADGELSDITLRERENDDSIEIDIPKLAIKRHKFNTLVDITENGEQQQLRAIGELNPSERRVMTTVSSVDHRCVTMPLIERKLGGEVKFDSISYSLTQTKAGNSDLRIAGRAEMNGLQIYHKRLSPELINLDHTLLDFRLNIAPQTVELDSSSLVRCNALTFNPYIRLEHLRNAAPGKEWHFTASLNKPWFPAQELFGSLPKGLFQNLEGMQVSGNLAYKFLLDIDQSQIDSLKFVSEMKRDKFKIVKSGRSHLGKMSSEFTYTAYENGVALRSFPVGESWCDFTPLDSIPQLLQVSVMQSEDGAFFSHNGFLPDAMREALIYDLKVKRFARGGSTISMQLVKNVFLNRNKNIARKLEEALIVWLIESQRLSSKARMYEVYLNIAEWGPMVYGIGEASQFYFNKRPSQLSIEECIFLASIIPKPKHFRSLFTDEGQLKANQEGYFRLIATRLVKKGIISEEQAAAVTTSNVIIKGEAKSFFAPSPADDATLANRHQQTP